MTNLEFRTFRSRARLTQARVALRADVDRTRVCMWENGDLSLRAEEVKLLKSALSELISERAEQLTKSAQTHLRHSNSSTTMDVYQQPVDSAVREMVNGVAESVMGLPVTGRIQ
jgi:DNA-binding XRE family transcriptional regulator